MTNFFLILNNKIGMIIIDYSLCSIRMITYSTKFELVNRVTLCQD